MCQLDSRTIAAPLHPITLHLHHHPVHVRHPSHITQHPCTPISPITIPLHTHLSHHTSHNTPPHPSLASHITQHPSTPISPITHHTTPSLPSHITQYPSTPISPREEGVDPMFESALYDCSPCLDLIGGQVTSSTRLVTLTPPPAGLWDIGDVE